MKELATVDTSEQIAAIQCTSVFGKLTKRLVSCGTITACNKSNIITSSWLWVWSEFGILWLTSFSAKHSVSSDLVRISERESPSGKYSWPKWYHTLGSSTWIFPWSSLPLRVFLLMCAYTPRTKITPFQKWETPVSICKDPQCLEWPNRYIRVQTFCIIFYTWMMRVDLFHTC